MTERRRDTAGRLAGWRGALVAAWLVARLAVAGDVPFVEPFEDRSVGDVGGQSGWGAAPAERAQVQTNRVFRGERALMLATNAMVAQSFADDTATNVWVDFYFRARPRSWNREPALNADSVAGFYVNSNRVVVARSNETWLALSGYQLPPNRWVRFSVHLDYDRSAWDLYVADDVPNQLATPLATNLVFNAGATNSWFHAFRVKN